MVMMAFENGKSLTKEEIVDRLGYDPDEEPEIKSIFDMTKSELSDLVEFPSIGVNDTTQSIVMEDYKTIYYNSLNLYKAHQPSKAFLKALRSLVNHQIKYLEQKELRDAIKS